MKQGRSLIELATELERQASAKRDYIADTRALKMEHGQLTIPVNAHSESYALSDTAHGQLAEKLSIPKRYYDRMLADSPELLDKNVNHWFARQPSKNMVRTMVYEQERVVRGFLSDRFRALDNLDLALAVMPELQAQEAAVESCEVTPGRMYIKAVTPRIRGEVRVGDVVQAGIVVSNSEVGLGALSAQLMIYRLSCTNGAIAGRDYGVRRNHTGARIELEDLAAQFYTSETRALDDKAFFAKVADMVRGFLSQDGFDSICERLRLAAEDRIEGNPVEAVKVLANKYQLAETEQAGVLRRLIEGADLTRYGLLNAVTRHSQDVESYDRATELEALGGRIIELPRSDWHEIAIAA